MRGVKNLPPVQILEPQSAILTNVEVLAHFSLNPPRRPPNPPPNSRNFTPSPDLRDHNTVVKEFHDYVTRLSPHLLSYPSFMPPSTSSEDNTDTNIKNDNGDGNGNGNENGNTTPLETQSQPQAQPQSQSQSQSQPTDLDLALREIIRRLRPFQLTKAEVLMIVNLGVGLDSSGEQGGGEGEDGAAVEQGTGDAMEVDGEAGGELAGAEGEGEGEGNGEKEEGGGGGIDEEADYGALALLDTVIEDREERLSTEDVGEILKVVRETLGGKGKGKGRKSGSSTAGAG
ncbi:hypothetical protein AJ78_07339 [Emergomyces pasteurianus Ep9510]|uniref:DNA-directed RNA polymerase III subunit RPC9 n=1 Tax=Emergomyces pasteurianus Ep9510 TaxID=1447872 RepID=A0A1J9Q723_9EURO|nr:hypothetical protein AJ78_07339 [Emergomyces pasteurianus Ep9510]